ncbi:MAG TPA: pilus assembly protein TadG-related protein [Stellaceae bacterium]|nr:pilus assembly protein TadG-related protein [Stellaceae bacterium]
MSVVIKLSKSRTHRVPNPRTETPGATAKRRFARGLLRDKNGSLFVFMAVSLLALATATGVGIDFARGLNFKSDLQGAADAAAISGASIYFNAGYASEATTAASNYMSKAIAALPTNNGVTTSVTLSQSSPWTVTVNASATINSTFNSLLEQTIPISVTATANGPSNPNINFYMMLDDSPSMAIAATQSGINTMVANTSSQGGCAFGCHESNPSADNLGNPGGEDNYALAQNLGVTLRMNNLKSATTSLMSTAQSTAQSNSAIYGVAIYTFDYGFNTIQTLTTTMSTAQSASNNIALLEVYDNNCLTQACTSGDTDTNYDVAFSDINSIMPNPGNGTNSKGDSPQEVLFLVTDGVEDELVNGSRVQSLMNTTMCNTIKNRGIRIAVLYTTYYPLPTNSWYNTYISPFQPNISSTMQSCASPGLFFEVDTGGDITTAMAALFQSAVQSAYISK